MKIIATFLSLLLFLSMIGIALWVFFKKEAPQEARYQGINTAAQKQISREAANATSRHALSSKADSTQKAFEMNQKQKGSPLDTTLDTTWRNLPDSAFVDLMQIDTTWVLDIRYATEDNFMKKKVYPCPKALLRKVAAEALLQAQKKFLEKGYAIKIHDGYRPLSVQWVLWNSTPHKGYVADPRKGSNHNKGCAIDLTLILRETGEELDMGTPYDFFGKKAHHTYLDFPAEVLANRRLLKSTMESVGFKSISNEWWHYDFKIKFAVSDFPLPCH
ncbi:M15 family metallopeptidase [Hugenholtzia roseola]|uniref:M15 family metallopeptidase n=1 Tax=Hugenholtzia roseola TaxID=1002 RepID=UPI0012B54F54|nr:M15 family metallopeptidase [Hugenholtzia roseola]